MEMSEIKNFVKPETLQFVSTPRKMLIGGNWVDGSSGLRLEVKNPANEQLLTTVPAGNAGDIDLAVKAARRAFGSGPWSEMLPTHRERLLLKLADLVEANAQNQAEIESLDNGKTVAMARAVDVGLVVVFFRYMAGWATKIEGSTMDVSIPFAPQNKFVAFTRKEPVGVVGAIVA